MRCRYCGNEVLAVWDLLYPGHLALETPQTARGGNKYLCTAATSPKGVHMIWATDWDTAVTQGRHADLAWARA